MIKSFIEPLFIISLHIFIIYFLFVIGYSIFKWISIQWKIIINLMIFLFLFNTIWIVTLSLIHIEIWYFLILWFIILSFFIIKIIWIFQIKYNIPWFIQNILNIFWKILTIVGIIILCLWTYLFYWKQPLNNEKILMSYISDTNRDWYEIFISHWWWLCKPCIDENEFYNKDYSISYKTESVYGWEKNTSIKMSNANFITWYRLIWNFPIEAIKSVEIKEFMPGIYDWPTTNITITNNWSVIYKGNYRTELKKEMLSWSSDNIDPALDFYKNLEKIRIKE